MKTILPEILDYLLHYIYVRFQLLKVDHLLFRRIMWIFLNLDKHLMHSHLSKISCYRKVKLFSH